MTGPKKSADYLRQDRQDRLLHELDHDPYHSKLKLREPTVCPECRAVFHQGRWSWGEIPAGAHEELCPACRRIRDKVPAGFLTISGGFFADHKEDLMNLVHNIERRQKQEHPLQRIMDLEEQADGLVITFTDAHLTRGVGEALHKAYEGELNFQYTNEDIMLRVSWKR